MCFSAVLGLHAIKEKPVVIEGKVEIRPVSTAPEDISLSSLNVDYQMMYLALTYDHRMLDGREAVIFLVKVTIKPSLDPNDPANRLQVKEYIEDPRRMLLG